MFTQRRNENDVIVLRNREKNHRTIDVNFIIVYPINDFERPSDMLSSRDARKPY